MRELIQLEPQTTAKASEVNENFVRVQSDVSDLASATNTSLETINSMLNNIQSTIFNRIYPVGSVYITTSTSSTCPIEGLISGSTWTRIAANRVLQGASSVTGTAQTIAAGLPNITAGFRTGSWKTDELNANTTGAATQSHGDAIHVYDQTSPNAYKFVDTAIDASRSSSIYGNSNTVQPPAYTVNIWRRTA